MDTYIMLFFKRHYSEIYNKNTIMEIALYKCFQMISLYIFNAQVKHCMKMVYVFD